MSIYENIYRRIKKTIVELYETGNKTKSELAREYGTSECNVRAWVKKYGKIPKEFNIFLMKGMKMENFVKLSEMT